MGLSLVLDLSTSLYLALLDPEGRPRAARIRESGKGEVAHDLLRECLAEAGAGPEAIAELAVGIGPGSFTGIRVAVAMAEGLAFARRLPIHTFSSLAALLACAPAGGAPGADSGVLALIGANAGRYFTSLSPAAAEPAAAPPQPESVRTLDEVLALSGTYPRLVASGTLPAREDLARAFPALARLEDCVDFARILALARARPPVRDGVVRPNYVMASAAEEKRRAGGA